MPFIPPANRTFVRFISEFWTSLKGIPTFIGVAGTIATLLVDSTTKVSARWSVFVLFIAFALMVALGELAWRALVRADRVLPAIVQCRRPIVGDDPLLVLLEPSELFSHGDMVTFYLIGDDEFEQLLGVGSIVNIQQDGKIQAVLQTPAPEHQAVIERLAQNEQSVKRQLRVKPNVSRAQSPKTSEETQALAASDAVTATESSQ